MKEANEHFERQIEWEKGGINTARFTTSGESVTLEGFESVKDMIVKVNGRIYEVVDNPSPSEGQVFVDSESGEMHFGGTLSANSRVDVTYITEHNTFEYTAPDPDDRGDKFVAPTVFNIRARYADISVTKKWKRSAA